MKKLLAFLLLLMLCAWTALAEAPDYAAMTDEELTAAMAAISAATAGAVINTKCWNRPAPKEG